MFNLQWRRIEIQSLYICMYILCTRGYTYCIYLYRCLLNARELETVIIVIRYSMLLVKEASSVIFTNL